MEGNSMCLHDGDNSSLQLPNGHSSHEHSSAGKSPTGPGRRTSLRTAGLGAAYSVLAGNHDVSGDDTRGSTPYLQTMGPQRFRASKTFAGSDSSGYNTAHVFTAGGQEWLLLALDWRTSSSGFAWANQFIK